jgi:anti-anti-sigma factor
MSKNPDLEISIHEDGGLHILHLAGRLDTVTSPKAESQIIEVIEKGETIIINLKELIYISSAGLRLILVFMKRTKKRNARMIFCAPGEHVLKVFEVSNFLEFLEIAESIEEAVLKIRS